MSDLKRRVEKLETAVCDASKGKPGPVLLVEQQPGETAEELKSRCEALRREREAAGYRRPEGGVDMVVIERRQVEREGLSDLLAKA